MVLVVTLRVVKSTDDEHQLRQCERLHQTLKMEEVYRKHYASPCKASDWLEVFLRRRNEVPRLGTDSS